MPKKLVLAVIDSLKPDMLDQAVAEGHAPALASLLESGTYIRDCISTFPSVTPVASAAIATGCGPGEHHIPSMNWFHRGEERYVEYGSSLAATRAFGIVRSLYDTVYNMNLAHLSRAHRTVFEHLDDAGLRTACTTYLIYRGRTRHDPSGVSVYRRIAEAAQFRHPVYGARELFYADLFDSRDTGCTSALGMPGQRDRHTGCVGAYLVEHGLFDFLLFSLPDNDTYSHKVGPDGQVRSIAEADRALERIMHVAGGVEAFLEEHAVIVMSDHSQTAVESAINLSEVLSDARVLAPSDPAPIEAELAACPSARSAMVYALDETRRGELVRRASDTLLEADGVELVITRDDGVALVRSAPRRAPLRAGRRPDRPARPELAGSGRRGGARAGHRGRRGGQRDLPRCARPALVVALLPALGRHPGLGGARLRVRRLGRRRPRGRRQPRLASQGRLRGSAPPVRPRSTGARPVVARRRDAAGARALRCTVGRVTDEARAAIARAPDTAVHLRVRAGLRKPHNWMQLLKFCAVGASGYVVNLSVFAACVALLDVHHLLAATAAFVVAVLNNFWWNRHWTFRARGGHAGFQAMRFFTVSIGAFLFAAAVLELLVSVAGVAAVPAQAIAIVSATPLNFIGNKMWSFRIELSRD